MTLYIAIKDKKNLNLIINKKKIKNISLREYKENVFELNEKIKYITNFIDFLETLFLIDKNENKLFQILYKKYVYFESIDELKNFFIGKLQISDEKLDELDKFLKYNLNIFLNWYSYIISNNEKDVLEKVIYHTYHSTKGEEYENVMIVMEDSFGKKRKNAIKNFFIDFENCDEDIKNLIYVSFSRTKKNLFVYYIEENLKSEEKENITRFFLN